MSRSYITENDSTIGKKRTDSISDIIKQVRYNCQEFNTYCFERTQRKTWWRKSKWN